MQLRQSGQHAKACRNRIHRRQGPGLEAGLQCDAILWLARHQPESALLSSLEHERHQMRVVEARQDCGFMREADRESRRKTIEPQRPQQHI